MKRLRKTTVNKMPHAEFVGVRDERGNSREGNEKAWRVSVFDEAIGGWRASIQKYPRQREAEIAAKALIDAGVTTRPSLQKLARKLKAEGKTVKMFIAEHFLW